MVKRKKRVLVTGATGFIGLHVCQALLEADYKVRALCRSASEDLSEMGVEVIIGDVLAPESLKKAMKSCVELVHAAGFVSRDLSNAQQMMQVHVKGTRNVMESALKSTIKKVLMLSTSGFLAVGEDSSMVYHEEDPVNIPLISKFPYYLSKFFAERAALDVLRLAEKAGEDTFEIVFLNPTLTLGPGDYRASSTGEVRRFLKGEIPVVPSGGISFVDVRDVAQMVLSGLENGRHKERYLLSAVNMTFKDFFARLEEISGKSGPAISFAVPNFLVKNGLKFLEKVGEKVGFELPVSPLEAEMSAHFWYVDARKAEAELGFEPRDPMVTLKNTISFIEGQS